MVRQTGVLLLALALSLGGCHRSWYRLQATRDAETAIAGYVSRLPQVQDVPRVEVDPRSRMYDPFDPDREPMPPDDPWSHELMHEVAGHKGYPHWHRYGETPFVENPEWIRFLPLDERGVLRLDGATAVRLALLHSPDYQREVEELFLSALDVTAERFRFQTQFFGGYGLDFEALGRENAAAAGDDQTTLTSSFSGVRLQRAFTTGADLVIGLANSIVWTFTGPDTNAASTLIDLTLVQPLLRRAGRDRVMETLTLAERTLLANVRQMERFRKGFQVELLTGSGRQAGPSRRGGFFGGSGLAGFTGVGGGGFGRVGQTGGFGGGGAAGPAVGAEQAGGFFGLLQSQQNIRNLEANITALRSSLAQLEAFFQAGFIDSFQVDQARQDLFERQSELLNARNAYQNALDAFKRELGLPPQLPVEIQDDLLKPFELIDPEILAGQQELASLQQQIGRRILTLLEGEPRWDQATRQALDQIRAGLKQAQQTRRQVRQRYVPSVRQDLENLTRLIPQRRQELEELRQRLERMLAGPQLLEEDETPFTPSDLSSLDPAYLDELPRQLAEAMDRLMRSFQQQEQESQAIDRRIDQLLAAPPPPDQLRQTLLDQLLIPVSLSLTRLSDALLELSLIQAQARTESITLVPIKMDADTAVEIARRMRLDWMNARAALVDAWRLLAFNADNLESDLSVVFSGEIGTLGNNPVKFRAVTGALRAGLQWDPPFTRLLERNIYREALIDYQQARRRYYQFEDAVAASLRRTLRQIELNQVNFELRRAAVRVAVRQVEAARLRLQEPPRPGAAQAQPAGTRQFSEVLTRNLVDALGALRRAQDNFLSVWLNYEVQRRILDLDLGTMRLDQDGQWIDPGPIGLEFGYPDPEILEHLPGEYPDWQTGPDPLPEPLPTAPPPPQNGRSAPPEPPDRPGPPSGPSAARPGGTGP